MTNIINHRSMKLVFGIVLVAFAGLIFAAYSTQAAEPTPTITTVDANNAGQGTSVVTNNAGEIVIAYFDVGNLALNLAICEDKNCNSPEIETVDNDGAVGVMPSIVINEEDLPIITYVDITNDNLKIAVCDDPACTSATVNIVDSDLNVGFYNDIVLTEAGLPIISYYDAQNARLKIAYCNDLHCTSPNLVVVDDTENPGLHSSLALGDSGLAVIAYHEKNNEDLKIAFCNDLVCSAPTIKTLDAVDDSGEFASLSIVAGRIFVTYMRSDGLKDMIKVVKCNDATCDSVSILHVLQMSSIEHMTSYMDGNEILISYLDPAAMDLMVAVCKISPSSGCSGPTYTRVDQTNDTGSFSDITVDQEGTPIISYHYASGKYLKLASCSLCRVPSRQHIGTASSKDAISLVQGTNGNPIMTYQEAGDNMFYLVYCQDRLCEGFEKTAIGSNLHINPSMALQPSGRPALAYFHATTNELKYTTCDNDDCTAKTTNVIHFDGFDPSLIFTTDGLPIISYYDATFNNLHIAYCQDIYCGSIIPYTLDAVGDVGKQTSMILTPDDEPMISYYDATNNEIKFILCHTTDCSDRTYKVAAPNSGPHNDIVYKYGRVYVAHYQNLSQQLAVATCDMPCGFVGSSPVDTTSLDNGWDISLHVGEDTAPLVSYYDSYYGVLKVASCYSGSCFLGSSISVVDEVSANSGRFSEMILDENGNPIIAHVNMIIPSARIVVYDSQPTTYQVYAPAVMR